MFLLKQFLKEIILPPMPWLVLLILVLIFWRRRWARKLLVATVALVVAAHSPLVDDWVRYSLESRYSPLIDPQGAEPYDAIVVLMAAAIPAGGLAPFPRIDQDLFRRLDEAWRLYRLRPKPIIVSGGHVNPFTPSRDENGIAHDYLILWGVPQDAIISEGASRDTFESAVEVEKILSRKGWKRYLLVTSAMHMARSMLAFQSVAPEPIPAPGDFTVAFPELDPFRIFPSENAGQRIYADAYEYAGLVNYYWRLRRWEKTKDEK
jgi:uncharacterized SAM-binding protein YcdF (DUF218 family)